MVCLYIKIWDPHVKCHSFEWPHNSTTWWLSFSHAFQLSFCVETLCICLASICTSVSPTKLLAFKSTKRLRKFGLAYNNIAHLLTHFGLGDRLLYSISWRERDLRLGCNCDGVLIYLTSSHDCASLIWDTVTVTF